MNLSSHLPAMLDFLGKGFVVSVVALSAAWLLRRASAAQRHLVWLCAVAVLLALPIAAGWRGSAISAAKSKAPEGPVLIVRIPAPVLVEPSSLPAAPVAAESFGAQVRRWAAGLGWRGALVGLWAGGVLAGLVGHCLARIRLIGLSRRSRALADPSLLAVADGLARETGLRRRVAWRVSADAPVAMTWGWWRPVVILPEAALVWPRERLELVMRHELAHVARGDSFTRALAGFACVLHWPNPLVWLVARRLRLAQEQACDDAVLAAGASAEAYAEELLAAARAWGDRNFRGAAVSMAEPSTLERRILGVLGVRARNVVGWGGRLLAILSTGGVMAGCSMVRVGSVPESAAQLLVQELKPRRWVEVELWYLEIDEKSAAEQAMQDVLRELLDKNSAYGPVVGYFPKAQREAVIRLVTEKSGARRIPETMPMRVLTRNDMKGSTFSFSGPTVRYPAVWNPQTGEATKFEDKNTGPRLSVNHTTLSGDRLGIEIKSTLVQLEGFVEQLPPPDGRYLPIFSTQDQSASVALAPGQCVVFRIGMVATSPWPLSTSPSDEEVKQAPPKQIVAVISAELRAPESADDAGR